MPTTLIPPEAPNERPVRGSQLLGSPAFANRTRELGWLERHLDEALAGVPRIVLIEGDAGIGKTRLLREIRSVAIGRGMRVCQGRAREQVAFPHLLFVEALRSRLVQERERFDAILGEDAEAVGTFLRPNAGAPEHATPAGQDHGPVARVREPGETR